MAVGDKADVLGFKVDKSNSGGSMISDQLEYYICTVSVDALVKKGFQAPSVLKIDVEGHEIEVFKGIKGLLSSDAPRVIIFETYKHFEWVNGYLSNFGYSIRALENLDDNYIAIKP